MTHPGGRPPIYNSVEDMQTKIDEYFDICDSKEREIVTPKGLQTVYKPYTISGLCLHLEICRDTLLEYQNKAEFSDTIKRAKARIENFVEEHSITGELNPAVSIFNLKNNFGWKDKIETENLNVNMNDDVTSLSDDELAIRIKLLENE